MHEEESDSHVAGVVLAQQHSLKKGLSGQKPCMCRVLRAVLLLCKKLRGDLKQVGCEVNPCDPCVQARR